MKAKKTTVKAAGKKNRKLALKQLEKKVLPSPVGKKSPIPPPYAPGTDYGLARRSNLR